MSNRTDFDNVATEAMEDFFSEEECILHADLRERIQTELHDAFVAGQEAQEREHRSMCLGVKRVVERCPICHGTTSGGHERDGSDHCWGHDVDDEEGPNAQ